MNAASMRRYAFFSLVAVSSLISFAWAQQTDTIGHQDTPLIPGTKWHVHDGLRPQPRVVDAAWNAGFKAPAPKDAIVLFDGKNLDNWRMDGNKPAAWKLANGVLESNGTGDLFTKQEFGDCQLHVEWATPSKVEGSSQGRGNSGVWMEGRYEIQILDSYKNPTYPDGQAGAVYGQMPPMFNPARKPGEWQSYDIYYTAPRFEGDSLKSPAYVTVVYNGILVQNHTAIIGDTVHAALAHYNGFAATGPIKLQDHHNPIRFRNIWVRPLPTP